MTLSLNAPTRDSQAAVSLDLVPDYCPICLQGIEPVKPNTTFLSGNRVEIVLRCPRQNCEAFFIGRYRQNQQTGVYRLFECTPLTMSAPAQNETVAAISPDFMQIFKQAYEAEQRNLTLVCGPGYRKALEFLVKDYVIKSHADKAEDIKKQPLGHCIFQYVSNDRVKQVAARAVWLGNDETHYLRKWEGKDLQDLKGLIELTVHWIVIEELTEKTLADMPEGK